MIGDEYDCGSVQGRFVKQLAVQLGPPSHSSPASTTPLPHVLSQT
ncbi:MAG TPA: hypothetical protein VGL86_30925 [Polyangia bacterium]